MISIDEIKKRVSDLSNDLVRIRRHLHQHPELSFHEHETAAFISRELDKRSIDHERGIAGTGIVLHIKGKNPKSKTIALRADLDALPISEMNNVAYKSVNQGVMHACGHDVHSTCLLASCFILHDLRDMFNGTIKAIFQPGEEVLPGGASLMIEAGVLENPVPETILGQHVYPNLKAGKVGFRPGKYMASADEIYITFKGKGGHAAEPYNLIDPVLITAQAITSLQQVVSRKAPIGVPTVLSFGKIAADGATNVVPNEVRVEGTFRTLEEKWRFEAHQWIERIAQETAKSLGGEAEVNIKVGYPFLHNDEEFTSEMKSGAIEFLGADNVADLDVRMGGEDFAYYSQKMPGCFYRLGVSSSDEPSAGLHTPYFDVDERALTTGTGLMTYLTLRQLFQNG
ncbi:MAG TPA: amidohydrolase [Flavobacteriales bacterium]|jgi:amidohydrolase|nr:amidohydrolase [Flavobacteriales bacterium]